MILSYNLGESQFKIDYQITIDQENNKIAILNRFNNAMILNCKKWEQPKKFRSMAEKKMVVKLFNTILPLWKVTLLFTK